ncbi:methylated-DNA--[protein]-cysteine S-methyltransferase [Aquiluna sp.]|jgi:methylated-DNA-[protein]-cysteine S-methyltransferase|nr:methylated-DNA--[protein]-cysteine S-methyltransferase [Aquiluna sp.]MDA8737186.1 methylated-DNA--[protein]-cysteine S-methyltransferase [Aquiluna sp.]
MEEITAREVFTTALGTLSVCVSKGRVVEVGFVSEALPSFAESSSDNALAKEAASQLRDYFAGKRESFDLPLHFSGTKFQEEIWQEIAKVPFGQSATYKDLAMRIGKPQAARAVGGAVGANPIGIIVGCHRILGSSGKLTGYSGGSGVPTKKKLLELEGIAYK